VKYKATVGGRDLDIDVDRAGEVVVDGEAVATDLRPIDGLHLHSLLLNNRSYELHVERIAGMYYVYIEGNRYSVDVGDARLKELIAMSQRQRDTVSGAVVTAPMPGLVVKLLVAAGDPVTENQPLLILEAMKMENEIRSPAEGVVQSISAVAGAAVGIGDVLVAIAAPEVEGGDATEAGPEGDPGAAAGEGSGAGSGAGGAHSGDPE